MRSLCTVIQALLVVLFLTFPSMSDAQADERVAWKALASGKHVALIRHGNAPPGYWGDPPGFKIDDCATQRNLDDKGRAQARALGAMFRAKRVRVGAVRSSPWCRCLETARLMSPERLEALKQMIADWRGPGTLVLVTHALTVNALFGFMPEQAEIVVARPRPGSPLGPKFVGSIRAPNLAPD